KQTDASLRRQQVRALEAILPVLRAAHEARRGELRAVLVSRDGPRVGARDDRARIAEGRIEVVAAESAQIAVRSRPIRCGQVLAVVIVERDEPAERAEPQAEELRGLILVEGALRPRAEEGVRLGAGER